MGVLVPALSLKASGALFPSSPAGILLRPQVSKKASRRTPSPAAIINSLPAGQYNGLNVPCAHQRFGNDFGITYWGYQANNGPVKFDAGSRPWNMSDPSSSSKYYADVINKITTAQGQRGNILRFHLFFDGRSAPVFDTTIGKDSITGLSTEFKEDFFALCELAKDYDVKLIPVLWSFEALDSKPLRVVSSRLGPANAVGRTQTQANHKYLFEAANGSQSAGCCDAFVKFALTPLVSECEAKYPGAVLAWDIFNEPEWGMASCPEASHSPNPDLWLDWVSSTGMQTFVAKCAVGIHEAGSRATLGSASMRYNWENTSGTTPSGSTAYWSDSVLQSLTSNNSKAYLDFYQIHYYSTLYQPWADCYNPSKVAVKDFVVSNKAVMVGEIGAIETSVADAQAMIDKHYCGVLFWAFEGGSFGSWDNIYQEPANGKPGINKFPH